VVSAPRALAAVLLVLIGVPSARAAGLLEQWWQGITGADAKPLAASAAAPMETAQAQPSAAPTIPVVRPNVQTVSETLEITGNAAAVNQVKLIARSSYPHEGRTRTPRTSFGCGARGTGQGCPAVERHRRRMAFPRREVGANIVQHGNDYAAPANGP
jgi:hypothetical protein